jgi:5-methylcytosine-specific restriction protein A
MIADESYLVKGSAGNSQWADSVWLAVFDRTVTETAMRGFYPVYLVSREGDEVFLSLNQGTTEILERVGRPRYREVLEDTASRDVGLLANENLSGLITGPIDLEGQSDLARGYEAGNIVARRYVRGEVPGDQQLDADLTRMLLLYQSLVEGRGQVQDEDDDDPLRPPRKPGLEARRYAWHRRAERSRSLAAAAKKAHGTTCQVKACGKNLVETYGDLAEGYIEAHHLTAFASLEGRPTELDPVEDFAVVCPDCHRMLHRSAEPLSLSELSATIEAQASDSRPSPLGLFEHLFAYPISSVALPLWPFTL